jgi:imidazoleglycerol-phosphate dehydratase/histidinol-phosphatase
MNRGRKILFLDRDGTIIHEPPDEQIDSFEKLRFVEGVIPALLRLRDHGFEFVLVSNQDGLGTAAFPREAFEGPHRLMLQVLASQGIDFAAEHIDPSLPADNSPNRKPGIGMLVPYLRPGVLNTAHSLVVGDRETDVQLAANMGIGCLRCGSGHLSWPEIVSAILDRPRTGCVTRTTRETSIEVSVDLDTRPATQEIGTGIGFFDHMLEQLSLHGAFSLTLRCEGDLHVDAHHTIEDTALALGSAIDQALGDRRGIGRYGFLLAMDEAQANVAIDLSGRPVHVQRGQFTAERIGEFPIEMVGHFFQSLSQSLRAAIHIEFRGENSHHMCEAIFKGVGRALRQALARTGNADLPSSKGVL